MCGWCRAKLVWPFLFLYKAVASGIWLLVPFKKQVSLSKSMWYDVIWCAIFFRHSFSHTLGLLVVPSCWLPAAAATEAPLDFVLRGVLRREELPDEEIGLNLIPGYVVEVFKLQFLDLAGTGWLNSYFKQSAIHSIDTHERFSWFKFQDSTD